MCSTASIINLCAISLDRYIHIRNPFQYGTWVTPLRTCIAIGFVWLLSISISFLPIQLGWHQLGLDRQEKVATEVNHFLSHVDKAGRMANNTGQIITNENTHAGTNDSISYLDSVTEMSIQETSNNGTLTTPGYITPPLEDIDSLDNNVVYYCVLELNPIYAVTSSCVSFLFPCMVMLLIYAKLYLYARKQMESIKQQTKSVKRFLEPRRGSSGSGKLGLRTRTSDHKAAITLGIIMGVFLFCWTPFFVINIISAFKPDSIPVLVFTICTWLGYFNSTLNPVIYSIFNSEFRAAFKRVLGYIPCLRKCFANPGRSRSMNFDQHGAYDMVPETHPMHLEAKKQQNGQI